MDWLIAVPAWGGNRPTVDLHDGCGRYIATFLSHGLPAIEIALGRITGRARFVIHTDQPERLREALGKWPHQILPVPSPQKPPHFSLGEANREALALANLGEAVALLNADHVCSLEFFSACELRFMQGKRLVMMTGTRTLAPCSPPIGAKSRDLLRWAWEHRHPWITGCTWNEGKTLAPSLINFRRGENIVQHAFHLGPQALLKEKDVTFPGLTSDQDLIDAFPREQVHVVTSADEASLAEMSPIERSLGERGQVIDINNVTDWATHHERTTPSHRWLFAHRITLVGDGSDIGDAAIASDILGSIERKLSRVENAGKPTSIDLRLPKYPHFHIVIPAWGEPRHIEAATRYVIPSVRAALAQCRASAKLIVYTDQPNAFDHCLHGLDAEVRFVSSTAVDPIGALQGTLRNLHMWTIAEAPIGSIVTLLNADIVVSREFFAFAIGACAKGAKVVAGVALRVLCSPLGFSGPPVGPASGELLAWAWQHRHPIAEDCVWGRGNAAFLNTLIIDGGEDVVLHTVHLHPFFVFNDGRRLHVTGTIDDDFLRNYAEEEIVYISNAEVGFAELSPPGFKADQYHSEAPISVERITQCGRRHRWLPFHLRNLSQQIRICGDGPMNSWPIARVVKDMQQLQQQQRVHGRAAVRAAV